MYEKKVINPIVINTGSLVIDRSYYLKSFRKLLSFIIDTSTKRGIRICLKKIK